MSDICTSAEGARAVEHRYREFLEHWPVPSDQLRVPTCQGETFIVACAPRDAPPSPATTPQAREFAECLMLIHQHFKPRRVKVLVFGDDAVRRLAMPMLVTVGGRDALLDSYEIRRRLEQGMPPARVNLLPGQTLPILSPQAHPHYSVSDSDTRNGTSLLSRRCCRREARVTAPSAWASARFSSGLKTSWRVYG